MFVSLLCGNLQTPHYNAGYIAKGTPAKPIPPRKLGTLELAKLQELLSLYETKIKNVVKVTHQNNTLTKHKYKIKLQHVPNEITKNTKIANHTLACITAKPKRICIETKNFFDAENDKNIEGHINDKNTNSANKTNDNNAGMQILQNMKRHHMKTNKKRQCPPFTMLFKIALIHKPRQLHDGKPNNATARSSGSKKDKQTHVAIQKKIHRLLAK